MESIETTRDTFHPGQFVGVPGVGVENLVFWPTYGAKARITPASLATTCFAVQQANITALTWPQTTPLRC